MREIVKTALTESYHENGRQESEHAWSANVELRSS